ncbi:MAG: DNA polymerase I, partial [Oscillospiraceae bacterium]|nr:DNA polymerase I [Oscillospiraceae bacterium]
MKLMVLDGNSIINRAFYGVRPLTTREGLHTNALFGFVNILQRFLDGEQPDAVCVAFDRHEPTFRHEADEQYKANRHGMPEELHQQMPLMKEILAAMHIPCYDMAGYEADDLIGTISRRCEAANWDCVIVTGDRDALQLITDRTCVMLVSSKAGQTVTHHMDEAAFREKYGFAPQSLIDLKALMGDSSDNIRGVAGIGEKTATDLICRYETIDALYAALPNIEAKSGVITKLTAG